MAQSVITSDLYVSGNLNAKSMTLPAGTVDDNAVEGAAGIQASKLQHQYEPVYQQESATSAVSEQRVVHVVKGATATLLSFDAGAVVLLTGADTCTVDLLKNGVSILTAAISLSSGDTAYGLDSGALSSTTAVTGDVFEVKVTATHSSGTLPKGVFARLALREDAQ